ncbi:hypothetical protein [Actinomycetospora cinnamomea]|uniref:DUF5666 domain-containing protein n=1 Tax=Actinomycetospora cinnamomea TaxID=663609 RepID=A0A2U1FLE5_9PSEU|nr:hypothetical protein [Actinomycetospora cinnamomea]PVZ12998.1 hypothetical protein C8D89_102146 [Actinomycetospora cinnamomea]
MSQPSEPEPADARTTTDTTSDTTSDTTTAAGPSVDPDAGTSDASPETPDESPTSEDAAVTERFPVPPPAARRSSPMPQRSAPGPPEPRTAEQDRAAAVLDRPVDDGNLADRLRRPGLARSTRLLLLLLGAVVCLAVGALVGRATAPDTGPGSVPDLLGVVESVQPTGGGYPIVTVRAADGTLTPLRTTAGTSVAVPRPEGPAGLRVGQQVTVHAERGADGAITAVRVDVPGP